MNLSHRLYNIIIKTLVLSGVFVFIVSCENDIKKINELTIKQDSAIVSAENVTLKYTTNGIPNVLMKTPLLNRFIKDNKSVIEFPKGVEMFFYNKEGIISSTLKANYSIYYEDEGKWIAKYDVVAVNENGEQLNTEYLVWLRDEKKITTNQFVKITTSDGVIYGNDGFVSNQTFTEWEVINGRGVLNIENNE